MKPARLLPLIVLGSALLAAPAEAVLTVAASVGASNDPGYFVNFPTGGGGYSHSGNNTGAYVETSGSATFNGLDAAGDPSTMSFSGSASAKTSYLKHHLAASGHVSNVTYNPENPPYYLTGEPVNENGMPTFLAAYAQSEYEDVLTYATGFNQAYRTDFYFHITGSFEGTHMSHSIFVEFGGQSDYTIFHSPADGLGSTISTTWATRKFDVIPGQPIVYSSTSLAQFNLQTPYSTGGGDYSGIANFSNTVTLAGINLYDENDNLVSNWSLTAGSGTNYPIPEPAIPAFFALGMLYATGGRRR